jgi:hypothetical protein
VGKSRTSTRVAAAALLVATGGLLVLMLGALPSAAGPQEPPPTEPPPTVEPTTTVLVTEPPPPPTTAPPPPTTAAPPTRPPATAPAPPTTAAVQTTTVPVDEEPTTTVELTTTTGPPVSLVPPVGDTLPARDAGVGGGLSSDTKVAMVVVGLLAIAVATGALTYLYWKHTRPTRYHEAFDALDAITQVDAVPAVTESSSTTQAGQPVTDARGIFEREHGFEHSAEPPPIVTAEELFGSRPDEPAAPVQARSVRAELWGDQPQQRDGNGEADPDDDPASVGRSQEQRG